MFTKSRKSNPVNVSVANGQKVCSSSRELNRLLRVDEDGSDSPVFTHRTVKEGKHLIRAGQKFEVLYVVNAGFFKTVFSDDCGNEQVMGFPMKGDLLGTEGIGSQQYNNDVVALTDADVIEIPFEDLSALAKLVPGLDETMFRIISQQLIQEQLALVAIGALCAEARLARFLMKLGDQMQLQGCSVDKFMLRMSRQDIGSYLGMKIETVSRTLTLLSKKGIITVDQRDITIADRTALAEIGRKSRAKDDQLAQSSIQCPQMEARKTGSSNRDLSKPDSGRPIATPWSGLTDSIDSVGRVTG